MPMGTEQLVNKAVITSDSFGGGIGLTVEEADQFIDYVVDQSFLKNNARVERMNAATKKIDFVGLGGRVLKPAQAAVDPGNTVDVRFSQTILQAKEMIAVAEISDDSLEDNKEGDAFVDHLMRMVALQIGNELEEAFLLGYALQNTNQATQIVQLFDGWYKRAKEGGHIVDASTFTDRYIEAAKFSKIVKALPLRYRRDRASLRFIMADDLYQDYVDKIAFRFTNLGDSAQQGLIQLRYGNILMETMNLLPTDQPIVVVGGGNTTTTANSVAGISQLSVNSAVNFSVGDSVVIGIDTPYQETAIITAIDDVNKVLTFSNPLVYSHASGTTVKECVEDGTFCMLTDYRNFIVGIHRDIRIETERHARKRSTSFVLTLRVDVTMENPDAIVVCEKLKVA